jgi:hypothetical protein
MYAFKRSLSCLEMTAKYDSGVLHTMRIMFVPSHVLPSCLFDSILDFQKATSSIERDENYVPRTRADYNLPQSKSALITDYHEIFEETPIYTLVRMLVMQLAGWQYYLLTNALGSPMYPPGTNVRSFSLLTFDGYIIS